MRKSTVQNPAINSESVTNDRLSIEYLFDCFHSSLLNKATLIVGASIAEEIVQDTWLTLIECWNSINDKDSLGSWLHRVVFNKSLNRIKKDKRSVSLEWITSHDGGRTREIENYFLTFNDEPEALLTLQQTLLTLEKQWSCLSAKQQQVCEMRLIHGYPYDRIADSLGVTVSNSKVLLHRARVSMLEAIN